MKITAIIHNITPFIIKNSACTIKIMKCGENYSQIIRSSFYRTESP